MAKAKVAVTIDAELLGRLDALIARRRFSNRSQAIETAVEEKLARLKRARLARECAKLDPKLEKRLAEEGLALDVKTWPEF
jgi:metal-responsive CopG/Arc/MetJ family transcriptional regulator